MAPLALCVIISALICILSEAYYEVKSLLTVSGRRLQYSPRRPAIDTGSSDTVNRVINGAPGHVAFIVDGNGRWAQANGLPRSDGHTKGANVTVEVVRSAFAAGVSTVTLYLFSTENWKRPPAEIANIFAVLDKYLVDFLSYLKENKIGLFVIGQPDRLPESTRELIAHVQKQTQPTADKKLCLAISYGGRADIVQAAQALAVRAQKGNLSPEDITEGTLERALSTGRLGLPNPDLVIRTSGEFRLSNFLLWQCAYAEFKILPCMWPEMTAVALREALVDYSSRQRRFGGVES